MSIRDYIERTLARRLADLRVEFKRDCQQNCIPVVSMFENVALKAHEDELDKYFILALCPWIISCICQVVYSEKDTNGSKTFGEKLSTIVSEYVRWDG